MKLLTIIMDDDEIITRLGVGWFSEVFNAKEKSSGGFVAIKALKKIHKMGRLFRTSRI